MREPVMQREPKMKPIVDKIEVTLEDLYFGKTVNKTIKIKELCKTCLGIGGDKNVIKTCRSCNGTGAKMVTRPIGPGMIQQFQTVCDQCKGEGEIIPDGSRCKTCNGQKLFENLKKIEIKILPGMEDGENIILEGAGEQYPKVKAGDVVRFRIAR